MNPLKPIAKKLDRILVNDQWSTTFPSSYALFSERGFSDHASCGVVLELECLKKKSPFKFYNLLLKNEDFLPMICYHWFSINVVGSAMFRLSRKLKLLKKEIRAFSRLNYSCIELRVQEAHADLLQLQAMTLDNPTTMNDRLELEAQEKWTTLAKAEESFLFQCSRVTWSVEGDSNTLFYHKMVASRKAINHIHFLVAPNGDGIETQSDIMEHCVEYFSSVLGGTTEPKMFINEDLALLLPYKCTSSQKQLLYAPFSRHEIRDTFFALPRNKTCGPDSYPPEFFCACWDIIGPEVCDAIQEFFSSGDILKQWNATTLVLIPKITNASSTTDFRPISWLNTLYKVISKLLASRLLKVLLSVISPAQSAFMPSRLIGENVLLATELVKGYNQSNIDPGAMLKVDLRKAFDSVRWDFVLATLEALEIPPTFINWIASCICTPTFSVSMNGDLVESLQVQRV